jgi:hypothetical protein
MLHNVTCPWREMFDDQYFENTIVFIIDSDTQTKSPLSKGKLLVEAIAYTSLLLRI